MCRATLRVLDDVFNGRILCVCRLNEAISNIDDDPEARKSREMISSIIGERNASFRKMGRSVGEKEDRSTCEPKELNHINAVERLVHVNSTFNTILVEEMRRVAFVAFMKT